MSPAFIPNTIYVTYIAASPEKVWEALTQGDFTQQYFFGHRVDLELKVGGAFRMYNPKGDLHIKGEVRECDPARRLSATWNVLGIKGFDELPECLITYEIEKAGDAVKLTMTEANSWDIPEEILAGGRQGWPLILSSLKTLLETGKPLAADVKAGPPQGMVEAVNKAIAEKPWLRERSR